MAIDTAMKNKAMYKQTSSKESHVFRYGKCQIQYLWTEALKSGSNQTVYIPSNAGIPVTEANRLGN